MKADRTTFIYFVSFALLVVLFRYPSYNLILDTDSSVNAFFARQMLRGETLYDRFHTAHHLPGIYYTFLISFKLFGDQPTSPKVLLIFFITVGAWLLYQLGRQYFEEWVGLLSAFFYILGSSQHYLAGNTVEMEHFANQFMIATVLLFFVFLKNNASPKQYFWIGVLGAICILYKVTFIAPLGAICIATILHARMQKGEVDNFKIMILRLTSMGIGVFLPFASVALYFASLGLWERFVLVFQLGFGYVGDQSLIVPFPKPFGFPLFMLAMTNIVLMVVGFMGAYRLTRRALPLRTLSNLLELTLVIWLFFALFLAGFRGGGYQHYVLIVIPPLSLTAASEIVTIYNSWKKKYALNQSRLGVALLISLIFINFIWRNIELYRYYFLAPSQREATFQVVQRQQTEVFNYIHTHTVPEDFIYVWSINLQTYYYTDRLPPIDIVWPSYIAATGYPERIFNPHTKYIVVADADIFFRPEWLIQGLAKDYVLETIINDMEIYRRNGT